MCGGRIDQRRLVTSSKMRRSSTRVLEAGCLVSGRSARRHDRCIAQDLGLAARSARSTPNPAGARRRTEYEYSMLSMHHNAHPDSGSSTRFRPRCRPVRRRGRRDSMSAQPVKHVETRETGTDDDSVEAGVTIGRVDGFPGQAIRRSSQRTPRASRSRSCAASSRSAGKSRIPRSRISRAREGRPARASVLPINLTASAGKWALNA